MGHRWYFLREWAAANRRYWAHRMTDHPAAETCWDCQYLPAYIIDCAERAGWLYRVLWWAV